MAFKGLSPAIFFDDHRKIPFYPLVSRETPFAGDALSSPSDHVPFFTHPGIDHLVFNVIAERAAHAFISSPENAFAGAKY
jgi:hypothetical protein